jgi:hypothetical protein
MAAESIPVCLCFLTICGTFRSGGTWIRTGDTMIFRSVPKPSVHRHGAPWAESKRCSEITDRCGPPRSCGGIVVGAEWVPDRRLCALSHLPILTVTSWPLTPFLQSSSSDWGEVLRDGSKAPSPTPLGDTALKPPPSGPTPSDPTGWPTGAPGRGQVRLPAWPPVRTTERSSKTA